jgi:hypothetical protein
MLLTAFYTGTWNNCIATRKILTNISLASKDEYRGSWARPEEVTQLLKEIVLSYRLLFGQDQQSRRFYKKHFSNSRLPTYQPDELLLNLCTKTGGLPETLGPDRESYRLSRDFPILRQRIAILQHQLSSVRPRGWLAMWRDKRDRAQWYTFWAVIMFGSLATFLALLQTIMQGIQTFSSHV